MTALLELLSSIGPAIAAGVALFLAALGYGAVKKAKGRKVERDKQEMKRLKDNKATRERIDDAKPTDNPDDARANLSNWLRGRK